MQRVFFTGREAYLEMPDHIYYMVCRDMPHLLKIGITTAPHHRLRAANKHDTYLPPSGYVYGRVLRVQNSLACENYLKWFFNEKRCRNAQGNCSEFFKVTAEEVNVEFDKFNGEEVDVATFDQAAEKKEMAEIRAFLKECLNFKTECFYLVPNPKTVGSKCFARFERYKSATTLNEALALGSSKEDMVYDFVAGYLHLGTCTISV